MILNPNGTQSEVAMTDKEDALFTERCEIENRLTDFTLLVGEIFGDNHPNVALLQSMQSVFESICEKFEPLNEVVATDLVAKLEQAHTKAESHILQHYDGDSEAVKALARIAGDILILERAVKHN